MLRKFIRKNMSFRTRARIARWFAMIVTVADVLWIWMVAEDISEYLSDE